jgi:hypothetical protein
MTDIFSAGFFYCPYIPLQISQPKTKEERKKIRRQYLLQCSSFPYSCTGECNTQEYKNKVDEFLNKEFKDD